MSTGETYDAIIVGGGHNGLVAGALLARAGRSVLILERRERVGGAAISGSPFDGVGARLSRYAYLVSLFPPELLRTLDVDIELRRRRVSAYAPDGDSGLLVDGASGQAVGGHGEVSIGGGQGRPFGRECGLPVRGNPRLSDAWRRFNGMVGHVAARVFPTLARPRALSRHDFRRLVGDDAAWDALFEQPLSVVLEETFSSDLVRGIVLTDATIGTFARQDAASLHQNRCYLYHVIGNGTGRWDVPVGGGVPPCELYCHSLTDPSILSNQLREAGAHTMTMFALHMPARLFGDSATHAERKAAAVVATFQSLDSVLAEPIEDCLWRAPDGTVCLEALTPRELEAELGMPGGHIFHRDLAWPFAESEHEVGSWGVETSYPNVWLCGAGARRGGGVSGIPGHNAARAVLATWSSP